MLRASTFQLLRIPFSFFLMPVYWFALSCVSSVNFLHALIIFVILHLFLYPASHAYNSYMDRDTGSIGGVEKPLQPTKELYYISLILDSIAFIAGFLISFYFALCTLLFILASRAYSYRGIRLKKYPVISYITAIIFQGAMVYFMVYHGSSIPKTEDVPFAPMIASALLVGSFYPLTQIYQHEQDKADGVKSMSMLLGYRGTFVFSAVVFFTAIALMGFYFAVNLELDRFLVVLICNVPVLIYFFRWFIKVRKEIGAANFKTSLRMNIIAAVCTNTAFIILLIIEQF